ncbi:Ig-like domain-containing protein [Candidatus Uhrbacteria bacterium]|nr:Ig-like domain-containing protein [Candidatus Uhrbacteria bacterium]
MQRFKKILSTAVTVTTISWSIGLGTLIPLLPANANVPTINEAPAKVVSGASSITPNSADVAIFKWRVTHDATDTFKNVNITINAVNGLLAGDLSAVKIFTDTNNDGIFNVGDTEVTSDRTAITVGSDFSVQNSLSQLAINISNGPRFFLTIKTSVGATVGRGFTVTMTNLAIGNPPYNNTNDHSVNPVSGTPSTLPLTTDAFTITAPDSTPPTASSSVGGPSDGNTNIPTEAIINRGFSEALANVTTGNVTLYPCTGTDTSTATLACGALAAAQGTVNSASNLCTGVTNSPNTLIGCTHAPLNPSTWYRFRIGIGVTDTATNPVALTDYRFQTGAFSASNNITPPHVVSSTPSAGSQNVPTNTKIQVVFPISPEGKMVADSSANALNTITNVTLKKMSSTGPGNEICTSGSACTLSATAFDDADTVRSLKVSPAVALDANSDYQFCLKGNIKNIANQALGGDFCVFFHTASGTDSTAPTLRTSGATTPADAATNVSIYTNNLSIAFSEQVDPSTMTLTNVRLYLDANTNSTNDGGDTTLGANSLTIQYDSGSSTVRFAPTTPLVANKHYCFQVTTGAKDLAGNAITAVSSPCFTTAAAENAQSAVRLMYADADNFKIVAHFSGPVKDAGSSDANSASNPANYSLVCPSDANGNGQSVSLSGKAVLYRAGTNEVELSGLALPSDQQCRLTVSTNLQNLAGTAFDSSGTPAHNIADFKTLSAAVTGGFLGSAATSQSFGSSTDFATFALHPARCFPRNTQASKATSLECEFDVPTALPISSTFILTLPNGFTYNDGNGNNTRSVPSANSPMNGDINGPGANTVTISSASADSGSNTITVTTAGGALAANDHVRFEIDRLKTPVSPVADSRISIVVKDNAGLKVGQTITASPFTTQQGGSITASGKVCKGTTADGVCGGSDTGIASVKIVCDQMGGFGGTAGFVGHQEATTDGTGAWSIAGLTPGGYGCGIPPQTALFDANVTGAAPFMQLNLSADKADVYFKFASLTTGGGGNATAVPITITGGAGVANTTVDVFCSAGASDFQASAPTMKAIALDGSGNATGTSITLSTGKNYQCGIGPHIAFDAFATGGPPPVPDFKFMPPPPQQVIPGTTTSLAFILTTSDRTITGTVNDGTTGIPNVFVHAFPINCFDATTKATKACNGGFAQSKSDGTFTLNVSDGTYNVGADAPGLPRSTEATVTVNGGNASAGTLKILKSSTTVAGQVLDESGNGIKYAQVSAQKIGSSESCSSFTPTGGHSDSPTDSSGNYTLYLSAGTWCMRAFSPAYGEVGNKTVTVSTSLTGQNIQATAANFGTISGTITKANTAVSGAFVNCFSPGVGGNGTPSSADGTYSLKVKAGAGYACDGFLPGFGPLPRQSGKTVTAGGTTTVDFTISSANANAGTINITIAGINDAFCDARDASGFGNGTNQPTDGVYSIKVPAGTYTIRCGGPKYGPFTMTPSSITIAAGATGTATATAPTTRTVAGKITDGTNNVAGASLSFADTTGKVFIIKTGSQTTGSDNLSATGIPEGTYNVTATKKGYEPATTTASVSGGNFSFSTPLELTPASGANGTDVTIPVQTSSTAYAGEAKVIATKSGKTVVGATDATTGSASLALTNGTWTVTAIGDNGKQTTSSSTVTVAGGAVTQVNGVNTSTPPTLSLATAITGYTAANESQAISNPSAGGLVKFQELSVGGKAPEINIPSGVLSSTDTSAGKVEMKTDATLAGIDPGADQNFVGSSGFQITPKDSNGNEVIITGSVTATIPYTDADVTAAGVAESKMQFASYNTTSQTWETFPTTVDTVNNTLTATITHFSSFGILGSVTTAASSTIDLNPPASPSNVKATSDGSKVTLTWSDPSDSDLLRILVLRNSGGSTPISGDPYAYVDKRKGTYTDTGVTAGTTYKYLVRAQDSSGNADTNLTSISVTVTAGTTVSAPSVTVAPTTPPPATVTPPPTTTTVTPPANTLPPPSAPATYSTGLIPNKVVESATEFDITLNSSDISTLTSFVTNGTSEAAKKLGSGERLAVVRDILETLGRASLTAIEQISAGEKPTDRNLTKEQAQVNKALPLFKKMLGVSRAPNFKNANEDLAWNTLMYRIRFDRDLAKEQKGIVRFKKVIGKNPSSPLDWAAVRAYGYKLAK